MNNSGLNSNTLNGSFWGLTLLRGLFSVASTTATISSSPRKRLVMNVTPAAVTNLTERVHVRSPEEFIATSEYVYRSNGRIRNVISNQCVANISFRNTVRKRTEQDNTGSAQITLISNVDIRNPFDEPATLENTFIVPEGTQVFYVRK